MVAFVEDEADVAHQLGVVDVVEQVDLVEVNINQHVDLLALIQLLGQALEGDAEHLHVGGVDQRAFESIAGALLVHHLDVLGLDDHRDLHSGFEGVVVLDHYLIAFVGDDCDLVMHALEHA